MDRKTVKVGLLVVMALLVALPVIGCATEEVAAPLPEEKVIKIGHIADLTGPYSTLGVPVFYGHSDYFRHVNEEDGGIGGIKIKEFWGDGRADAAMGITLYKRFKADGMLALIVLSSVEANALLTMTEADRIPYTGSATSTSIIVPPRWYYNSYCGAFSVGVATTVRWYYNEWLKKGLDRPMRVGIVTWDNPVGRDGWDGVIRWAEKQGADKVEVVAEAFTSPMAMDYSTEMLVMKAANPDVVVCSAS